MKIPARIMRELDRAAGGLEYGTAALEVDVKDGNPRFIVSRRESFVLTPEEAREFRDDGRRDERGDH